MTLDYQEVLDGRDKVVAKIEQAEAEHAARIGPLRDIYRKVCAWLWANTNHTADGVVAEYVALRDKRADLKKAYEAEDKELKARMERCDVWLLQALDSIGSNSFNTDHGTAFIQVKRKSSCGDWPSFWPWAAANNRFDLMEKRLSQKAISDMVENGETLPPGVNLFTEREVTVRRSN